MKKLFLAITIFLFSLSFLIFPFKASAEGIDFDCVREVLFSGKGKIEDCQGNGGGGQSGDVKSNFFGITFTADQAGAAKIIRTLITIALGALVIGAIFYGIYGIYVRSTSGSDENKMKESVSIFKNAVLAIVITAGGIVLIEILSIFLGLGNVWEFSFSNQAANTSSNKFSSCDPQEMECQVNDGTEDNPVICTYKYIDGRWVKTSTVCIE